MQMYSQAKVPTFSAGSYKPKAENVKKLKIYLNKLENGK
jgi:hypothetical protein